VEELESYESGQIPTLGNLLYAWIAHHCIVPDGFRKGDPFVLYGWQQLVVFKHYEVMPDATVGQLAPAFRFRRSQVIAPQKAGKGPMSAAIVCAEAVGPVVFAGWAENDREEFNCHDHGCACPKPLRYLYEPEEPMGVPWPTPLIQLVATAEDQVGNVYRPLQAMAKGAALSGIMRTGEEFIRLPNDGRIDVVTSSATSRLGQPITFAMQDETGLYTKTNKMVNVAETQRRGAAGMGGRTMETSNAWDPTQDSTAQRTARAAEKQPDIYRYHLEPPAALGEYTKKAERRKIHEFAYADSPHVDLDAIEAEAAELILEDPRQAERFFGNRVVAGSAKWMDGAPWDKHAVTGVTVAQREKITLGFDGSDGTSMTKRVADSTVLRGVRLSDGYRWTVGAWEHEDHDHPWFVPRGEVMERIRWCFKHYDVVLAGFDPPYWRSEISELQEDFGEDRVIEFRTANDQLMAGALQRLKLADTPHDGCPIVRRHVLNAVTHTKEYRDDNDERKTITLVSKTSKDSPDKIDGLIADAIANDMRDRAIATGVRRKRPAQLVTFR